jgi:mannosyl-3-phosphoglycerate phosphatase
MIDDAGPRLSGDPLRLVFTDLDGTLLDAETYSWEEAEEALALCRQRGVPVILTSSKTRAEMEILRDRMALSDPFISENGGGIFLPMTPGEVPVPEGECDGNLWKIVQGNLSAQIHPALKEIGKDLGYTIIGFSDMNINQIASLTGLDIQMARLAAQREFDEPFVIRSPGHPDIDALLRAAEKRGLVITQGGRFFHLHGKNNKGRAMERIIAYYRRTHPKVLSMALGDSPNDFPMLERADVPVLVRSKHDFPDLLERMPALVITRQEGPKGWNEAVLNFLESKE